MSYTPTATITIIDRNKEPDFDAGLDFIQELPPVGKLRELAEEDTDASVPLAIKLRNAREHLYHQIGVLKEYFGDEYWVERREIRDADIHIWYSFDPNEDVEDSPAGAVEELGTYAPGVFAAMGFDS